MAKPRGPRNPHKRKQRARVREQRHSYARVGRWLAVDVKLRDSTLFRLADCLADMLHKNLHVNFFTYFNGDPSRTRTPNLLIRSQLLYPVELRDRMRADYPILGPA